VRSFSCWNIIPLVFAIDKTFVCQHQHPPRSLVVSNFDEYESFDVNGHSEEPGLVCCSKNKNHTSTPEAIRAKSHRVSNVELFSARPRVAISMAFWGVVESGT
jgi:hypothetical protein